MKIWIARATSGLMLVGAVACGASSDDDDMNDTGSGGAAAMGSGGAGSGGTQSMSGTGGSASTSGTGGKPGSGGSSGVSGTGVAGASGSGGTGATDAGTASDLDKFSFFVISYSALFDLAQKMGKPNGFGGDLTYGETGQGAGLRGADKICTAVAERSMPGSGAKGWHAFLSTSYENAIERIGDGPWYDRNGRLFAMSIADLMMTDSERPVGIDATIADDFPNEDGVLNHDPDGTGEVDNHDMLTGSNAMGEFYDPDETSRNCNDWTSTDTTIGRPRVGHSWSRMMMGGGMFPGGGAPPPGGFPGGGGDDHGVGADGSFNHWISSLDEAGCGPGASLMEMGAPQLDNPTVGSGGGYGGFYCFASMP
jgi:hypothetical protein